jgi:predicted dithiol-disulfide oxidoreductase (DUF899 family)
MNPMNDGALVRRSPTKILIIMTTQTAVSETTAGNLTHKVVTHDEWLTARKALLAKEKQHTRVGDALAAERRQLPWVKVEKDYVFETPKGTVRLADLFQGRSQLVVYHFMFGPEWDEGCKSCSFVVDHLNGVPPHLAARDVTLVAVSGAPLAKLAAFKSRLGWQVPWVSSHGTDFNHDFAVTFSPKELESGEKLYNFGSIPPYADENPGMSVFYRDAAGDIFHTYSTYARGLEPLLTTYFILDAVPKGRDEDQLEFSMSWVRHHDRYSTDAAVAAEHGCCSTKEARS